MAHGMTLATFGRDRNAINATMAAHVIDNESIEVTADALSLQLTGKSSELDVIAGVLGETDRLLRTYAQEGPSEVEFDDASRKRRRVAHSSRSLEDAAKAP